MRLVAAFPDRFARVVLSNTRLPVGTWPSPEFDAWLAFSQTTPEFMVGKIVDTFTTRDLTPAEIAAYDAPFPDESYKEGARQFPALVLVKPDQASVAENRAAWEILGRFDKPVLTAFAEKDPVSKGGEKDFIERIPGARGQPHCIIAGAGHFIQEDAPEQLCALIDALIRSDACASAVPSSEILGIFLIISGVLAEQLRREYIHLFDCRRLRKKLLPFCH
jgi:haloalkane dehalogenase